MGTAPIAVGDVVAIRGDMRSGCEGRCAYLPEQLVDGKYVKHAYHDKAWTGRVDKIDGDMARVGGGWRGIERYEVLPT